MVKRICAYIIVLCFICVLSAQTAEGGGEVTAEAAVGTEADLRHSVKAAYRLLLDEESLFLAAKVGPYLEGDEFSDFPPEENWYLSLESVLSRSPKISHLRRDAGDADPVAWAADSGIPVFIDISINIDIESPTVFIEYRFVNVYSGLHLYEGTIEEAVPRQSDLLSFFWLPVVSRLEVFIDEVITPPVTITGVPGMKVYGLTDDFIVIPEEGTLTIELPMPATYRWRTEHRKYVSDQGIFLVHRDNTALELPRRRIYPTSIDVGLFLGRFPEIWVSRYLQRNGMFFSIGLQQQQFLLFPRSRGEALETSFNSLPLLMPGAALGYRFRPVFHPENEGDKNYLPRPYLSLALFLRCNYEKKSFDDFSPFSVTFSAGYDWAMPFKIHLFIELGAAFYILGEDYKNSRSKGTGDQGFIQQVLNGAAYFEFPSFRAGLKIPLPF